ncbi:hypothetical protein ACHQM5_015635 [Ranunculus cassubicifolius]
MSLQGLTCNISRVAPHIPAQGSHKQYNCISARKFPKNPDPLHLARIKWVGTNWTYKLQQRPMIRNATDASFGDISDDSSNIFPRINIRDPYKRLGISKEASEEEIQGARNFLITKYSQHKPSVDSIESAHDKIIMEKWNDRRRPKLNIKKKMKDVTQSRVVLAVTNRFQTPATNVILKTAAVFALLGVLTVLFPTEDGPTVQVAISLFATIYFIHDRLKSKVRALLYGVGAFGVSWLLGTFLMVSVIPPVFRGLRSLEVTTAVISYVLLWVSSTYLK